jgi:hypothetical protein
MVIVNNQIAAAVDRMPYGKCRVEFMPGFYEIRWLPGGRVQSFAGSRGNYYEISENEHLDLISTPVWCRQCGTFTNGEYLPTLAEIDEIIAKLRAEILENLSRGFGQGDSYPEQNLVKWERRRHWRVGRKSPPRCIMCGSVDIVDMPIGQAVPNPAGAGQVMVESVGFCSTVFNEWFFTPEGDRIPHNTKPTYWRFMGEP